MINIRDIVVLPCTKCCSDTDEVIQRKIATILVVEEDDNGHMNGIVDALCIEHAPPDAPVYIPRTE